MWLVTAMNCQCLIYTQTLIGSIVCSSLTKQQGVMWTLKDTMGFAAAVCIEEQQLEMHILAALLHTCSFNEIPRTGPL